MSELSLSDTACSARQAHALLSGRRSIRRYRPQRPPDSVITRLLDSAALAPSAHNRQPWRYVVITDEALKARLTRAMGARLTADRRHDGDAEADIQADVERSYRRITAAPLVIVVSLTLVEMDRYADEKRSRAEYLMAVQSTAMATQNLLLAAHAEGLGACWMCAPLFCPTDVRNALNIPQDWEPQGLVTLGYPAQAGKLRPRQPASAFALFPQACAQAAE